MALVNLEKNGIKHLDHMKAFMGGMAAMLDCKINHKGCHKHKCPFVWPDEDNMELKRCRNRIRNYLYCDGCRQKLIDHVRAYRVAVANNNHNDIIVTSYRMGLLFINTFIK